MSYELKPLPDVLIYAAGGAGTRRQKWLIVHEGSDIPLTCAAGRYTSGYMAKYEQTAEEAKFIRELKTVFRGYLIVSCPDPLSAPNAVARFEARIEKPAPRRGTSSGPLPPLKAPKAGAQKIDTELTLT
jgi:hypothetical protein